MHIPFTPGIIPKEKPRIAKAVGEAVSANLLDAETMSQTLLSDEMLEKISTELDGLLYRIYNSQLSIREFASRYADDAEIENVSAILEHHISESICKRLNDKAIGEGVAEMAIRHVQEKLSDGFLGKLGAGILDVMRDSAKRLLADNINEMLRNIAPDMIGRLVKEESQRIQNMPISNILENQTEMLSKIKEIVLKAYKSVVTNNLPKILAAINIQKIIEDRLNGMDMAETEKLIISVMDKELKALVWFGVALGFLMGFVTDLMFLLG